jgi:hypothetical protein
MTGFVQRSYRQEEWQELMADFTKWNEIPAELREACRWTGVILMEGQRPAIHFDCREWEAKDGSLLRVAGALLDTGDRHEGMLLKPRFTHLEEGYYGGEVARLIRPIRLEEN